MKIDISTIALDDDFLNRYTKTFVKLHYEKEPVPFLGWFYGKERNSLHFYKSTLEKDVVPTDVKPGHLYLESFLPNAKWYQLGGHSVYIYSRVMRQWKRSLCNTTHTSFSETAAIGIHTDSFKQLDELLVEKPSYSFIEGVNQIKEGKASSVTLTPTFSISNLGSIFSNNVKIGSFKFDRPTLKVAPMFKEDFSPLLEGSGYVDLKGM